MNYDNYDQEENKPTCAGCEIMAANSAEAVATINVNQDSELQFQQQIYTCANCDIKFDSESSLRVHLQVS